MSCLILVGVFIVEFQEGCTFLTEPRIKGSQIKQGKFSICPNILLYR